MKEACVLIKDSPKEESIGRGVRTGYLLLHQRSRQMATETVIVSTTCTGCSVQSQKVLRCRFPGQHDDVPASLDAENNTISCCVPSSVRHPSKCEPAASGDSAVNSFPSVRVMLAGSGARSEVRAPWHEWRNRMPQLRTRCQVCSFTAP